MALDNAAAQNEALRILNNNDQSQLLEEKLKRLVDLANLHDGDREQRDDVFTSLPEGASNNRQNYEQQAPSGNSSLPDASLDRPWISSALSEQQNPTLTSEGIPHNPERSGSIGSDSDLGTQDFQTPFALDSQIDGPAVLGAERPGGGEGNVPFPGPSGGQTPDHTPPGGSPKSNRDPHSPGETPKPGPGPSPDRATITVAGAPKDLTVDETDLTTDATANFGAYFSATYGVNGKGIGGMTFKIGVVQPGTDSGLVDEATGQHLLLFHNSDGSISGRTPGGLEGFHITTDQVGNIELDQLRSIVHPDPNNTDESITLKNPNLITITGTAVSAGGDSASATIGIGQVFHFKDDAPSLQLTTNGHPPVLGVDETFIGQAGGTSTQSFASLFSGSHQFGADGSGTFKTSYELNLSKDGVFSGLIDSETGERILLHVNTQNGNITGILENTGKEALKISTTQAGDITFTSERAVIHPDPTNTDEEIHLSPGLLALRRTDTITDKDGDSATSSAQIDLGSSLTIHDDAPSITPPATTGTIPDFVVTEQGGINGAASHNFSSNFSTGNSNAVDQNASLTTAFSFSLNPNGVDSGLQDHNGNHIFLFQSGDNVVGLVGNSNSPNPNGSNALQITLDPTSGQATFSSSQDLQHSDPSKSGTGDQLSFKPNVLSITRTDTITDADGDHASASNSLDIFGAFLINDTAPSITPPATTGTIPDFVVTEQGGINGAASHNFSSNFSTGNSNAVDQNASLTTAFSFSLNPNGVDSGLQDHNGNHIFLFQSGDNVVGLVGNSNSPNPNGSNALQITLDPTSGQATFSSSQDLQHSDPSKSGTGDQLSFKPNVLSITRTDTITDADGDHASASNSLDISGAFLINDTAPSITPPATTGTIPDFVVTEQGGINGAASHNFSSNFSTGNSNAVDQNASLTTAFSFSLNPNGVDSGLQDHNGNHIFLFQSGDNVVGLVGNSNSPNPNGSNALQITLDPTSGQATFSSSQDLQHSDPSKSGTGDQLSFKPNVLSITRTDTITDADGDHASASNSLDISGAFLINDTAPSITPPATTGTIPDFVVTEQGGINGAASHNFSSNFSTGNSNAVDQNASLTTAFSFSLNPNGVDSGLQDHNGNHIFLFQSGDNVVGLVGNSNSPNPNGSNALQITLDPTSGQATFSSSQDLQHSDPSKSGTGDQLSFKPNVLSITRTDTITDADGDHASASNSLDISGAFLINDTAPSITPPATTGTIPDFVVTEQGGINGAASHNFSSNFSTGNSNAVDQNASLTTAFSFSLNPNGVDSGLQDHNGNHIFLFQSGDNVVGLVGNSNSPNPNGSNALQITLDPTSGQATFSSSQDLQHSDPSKSGTGDQLSFKPNVLSITRTDTITDADGDHASASNSLDISGAFLINDTAPSITPPATTGTIPDFVVTEQGGINGAASHNFSSNFSTGNSNAVDQNASLTTAFSFSLNPNGVDSGLQDHNGNHIFLFQSGDNVVGLVGNSNSPNPNGSNALQITLDPTSGQATFSSSQDLQHSDPSKSGTGDQLSFKPNVLSITRTDTITDADGDHASASNSLDISGAFLINDTAPSITPPATTGTIPDFVVTEQGGINGAASHNFSSNFSTGNSNAVDQNASLTTAFSFSLNPNGVDSGLQDHNGNHIFLFQSGDNVVGLVGNSNSPNPNGSNALQITLDPTSGQATFSSSQDLQHSDPSKSGTGDQLSFKPNVLSITRTDTITDADGDHASASNSLDISGAFLINDTAPSITPPATTGTIPDFVVTEQGGINGAASHNFSSNFSTGNSNAVDQNASLTTAFSFSLNPNGVDSGLQDHNGNHIFLFQSGDNVVGLVGNSNSPNPNGSNALQITLDPTSGQATFSSSQDLQHSDPSKSGTGDQLSFKPNVLSITRTDTITDADGDHASASNSLDISGAFLINDTAPSITPPATTGTIPDFVVTEQGGINGAASHNFSSNFSTGNSNAVDQNASLTTAFSFSLNPNGVDSGLQDHNGNHIFLFQSGDNVVGLVGNSNSPNPNGSNALQITLDPTSGQATFSSSQDLQHSDPSKSGTGDQLSFKPNVLSITRTDTITDADGDHASASNSLDISGAFLINDTAPSITPPATTGTIPDFVVTEQGGINGAASHNFSSNFSTGNSNAVDQNASLTTAFSFSLNPNGVDSGLQDHNGNHIFLFQSGDNVVGLVGNSNSPNPNGSNALQITLDPTSGQATFSSSQDLQHSDPSKSGTGDQLSFKPNVLSITRTDTITDADGDHASASNSLDISGAFLINDTAPSITPPATTGTIPDFVVTEQGGINGAASHNFSSNFSTGNSNAVDQNASLTTAFSFSLNPNGVDSGLQDHNGNHIFLFQSGDNVVGLVGNSNSPNPNGSNALQITLDPTSGQATFSSSQDLQHSDPSKSGTGDQLSFKPNVLSITRTDTITDADGDHASASNSLDISGAFLINDTAPSITPPATTGTIPDFVVTEQGGINGAASHNFSSNFSTGNSNAVDQNASLTTAFSFSLNPNGVDSGLQDHNGNHIFLFQSGDNVVGLVGNSNSPNPNGSNALQITLDPTSGQATFSSSQDLQHSDPSKSGTGDQLSFKPNVLSITRTDTITDADGDHASASNSLDISGAFLINDTAPSITPPATTGTIPDFVVTEQGGINGAASHNFSSNFSTGNSNAVDQNASLTTAFSFSLNPNGVDSGLQDHNGNHIFLFQSGDNVVGLVGNSNSPNPNGSNALQITLDPTSGQATFSSSQDLQHSDPSKSGTGDQLSFKPNVLSITRTDTITDADGDHASASNSLDISGAFLINDTAPSITPPATTGTIPDFVVTEQGGINGAASHNFSSNFSTGNSNAVDQNASLTTAFSFSLNPNGVDSGLQDHNGNHIFLFQSGDNVVGLVGNSNSPNPNGSNALQITLDPTSGQATFSSSQDLQHSDPSKSGTGDQLSFKPNVLSITRTDTITDADGDHASASNSLDISGAFLINDTAPSITPPATTGTIPDFVVTEQGGINGAASHNFSSNFSTGNSNAVDQNASLTTAFSFSLNPNGVDSGLQDHNGNHIFLFQSGDNVVGLVGNSNSPNPNGSNALQITLDPTSGQATFSSSQDLQHSDPSKSGTGDQLSFKPNVLSITRTDTITDADGDHASASNSLDISGAFLINDTAPSVDPAKVGTLSPLVTDDDTLNLDATTSLSSLFSSAFTPGADGTQSIAYSLALSAQDANSGLHALNPSGGPNQGPEILLHRDANGVIHGYPSGGKSDGSEDLFTITIDGKNNLVLDQIKPIWQDNTSSNNEQTLLTALPNTLKITASITDQDGDSVSTSIDASSGIFAFQDSGPSVDPAKVGTLSPLVTDDDTLNLDATTSLSSLFSSAFTPGADGTQSIAYSLALSAQDANSGLHALNPSGGPNQGPEILLHRDANGVIHGYPSGGKSDGSEDLFTITIDGKNNLVLDQIKPIWQDNTSSNNEQTLLTALPNTLKITASITDQDGDSVSTSIDASSGIFAFQDSGPSVDPAKVGTLSPLVTDDDTLNLDATTSLSSLFSSAFTPGADGTQSIAYSLALSAQDANSGLHALNPSGGPNQGPEILLHRDANGVIHGYPSGGKSDGSEDLFTITIDGKNNLVLDQIKPIWQDNTSSNNEQTLLTALPNTLKITASITDQDGDSVSTSIDASSGIFAFQDSGPSVDPAKVGTLSPLVTDDDTLNLDATTSLSSLFSSAFTPGADGTQSIAYSLALSAQDANSGLHALNPSGGPNQGPEILLHRDANGVIHGYPSGGKSDGSEDLFTITIDGKNNLVLDQIKPIWQDNTSSNNEQTLLTALPNTLKITASITDQDGDSVSTSIDASSGIFAFQDSGPSVDPAKVGTLSPLVTDDDTLNLDATTSLSSLFSSAFTPGADGTQSIAYSLALSAQDANSGLHALNPSGGPNQGPEILLHRDANGVIHGYPSGGKSDGSEDLFTITIDGKNNLVLDQIKPIWQDNTSSNNEQTLLTALPNTLKITASITDQDGDSVSTSIDASSGIFAFQDSGPSVDPAKVGTLSPLVTDDDTLNLDATTSLSSLFSSAFTPGADGTQSIAYSLALSAQDANSGLHALNPSGGPNQGPEILLHRDANGVIHGYPSGGKSDGSEDLFTITIDGKNNLVLDQIKPIWQDNTSSNNEQTLLTALPNTLKITASITDQDGDSVSTSIDASSGIFAFQDSGPSVDPAKVGTLSPLVTDDDTLNLDATTSLSSLFSSAFTPGADGTQSIAYSLALSAQDANSGLHALNPSGGPNQGPEILLHRDANGVIHGYPSGGKSDGSEDLFTITIDGKNNLVLDQIKPIWQDNTSSNNEQTLLTALPNTLKITASITDQDGDSVSTSIDASSGIFAFQDSGPSVDPAKVGTLSPLVTDDDTLNLDATTSLSSLFSSAFTPGADGTQSIAYSLALSAQDANSGLHALNPSGGPNQGPEILLHRDANGVIHGYPSGGKSDGSEDLFTITIDGKNNLVLDQIKPIWQDNTSSNNEQTLLTALPNTLKITASITDQDGDSVSTSIDASSGIFAFQDSGPSVDPAKVGTLSPLVTDDDTLNLDATTSLSSLFSSAFTPGADGTQSIAYSLALSAQDANSGLHALNPSGGPNQGPEILLHRDANGVIHGYPSGGKSDGSEDLFTITIDGKNNLVLDQIKPIWQDNTSSNNEQTLLTALPNTLKITASITDQDGDSVSTSIDASSGIFAFQDSGPSVDPAKVGTLSPLVTDDDTLNLDATTSLSSLFSSAFTPGADGTQSIAYSLALSAQDANSGLHALNPSGGPNQGPEILLHRDANGVIHGYPSGGKSDGSEDLFTITIDGKNNLVLDQIKPIWQDNTSSNNEQTLLTALPNTLKITASITDQDGDSVSTSIDASSGIFAFQDSGPSISMGKVSVSTTQHPQTPLPPSTGTTTTTTTTIFDPHQNLGLVLDYSGSMGWSGHNDPDDARPNSRIHQQLLASVEIIKQAFENAGYKVTTPNGLTHLTDWKLEPLAGHTPGNIHLSVAIFGGHTQTESLTINNPNDSLQSINNILHHGKISGTNHTEAWKAAQNITTSWQQSNISDLHQTKSGAEIKTDTNMLIMTDGETSRGQDMISDNSYVLTTYNKGQHHYGLNNISGWNSSNKADSELKITYTDSAGVQHEQNLTRAQIDGMINDHNHPLGTSHGYSNSRAVQDKNGDIIGWLGFPKVIDPNIHHHHPNPIEVNPLVFTPNEANGITITKIENNKSSGPNDEITSIMSSGFNSQGAQLSHNLDQALLTLDQQVGHEKPNVIGVGIVDPGNTSIGSQLQTLFNGSLPAGSSFTQVSSQTNSNGSLSQQIQTAVQQSFQNVDVHFDFNFDPGSDDDLAAASSQNNGVVEFTLEQKSTLLGTGGHSPVQAFAATFGGNQNTSNVKDLGNGEFEIKINGLGTFTINTGNTVLSSGSHNGTIDFKPNPGVSIGRNLDLTLSIKDADGDTKSVNFTLPKFNTNVTPSQTQHDEPDQNGFTADISVIANDALTSAQADSDTEATLAALISLGLKTDHDDVDLSQSTQEDGSQLITRTIHTDQGDILETITDPQNGNAPSLQLDVSGLDADTQKDLQATIQAQTSSSASESKPGQLDSVLGDATQSPPAIDGHSLADAISDLQQLDADAIAALNGQDTSTNSADGSSLSGDAALTPLPQDPSDVPVTSMEDAFASPQQTDDDVMAPPDLSDTSQTAAPLPDNSTQDQDLSLLNT